MNQQELYQSVLRKLGDTPAEYLPEIDQFLRQLHREKKANNRDKILALAGAWSDMNEEDFQDYLRRAKETGSELFDRRK